MKTKTASVRLPTEMYEEIDSICDGFRCSRNDWIKDTLKEKLREESNEYSQSLEDIKPEPKPTLEGIPEIIIEDVKEPKATIELIPEPKQIDNSNNPPYQMTYFNGKLLPYAKRYNIWHRPLIVLIADSK